MACSCATVSMPMFFSAASVTLPIPGILRTASGARKAASLPAGTQTRPRGLACSLATFATSRVAPSPPEHGKSRRRGDFAQQFMRGRERRAVQPLGAGEIEIGLVDRCHLHDRRIFREDRGDAVAPLPVQIVVPVEKNSVRAKFRGGAQRHRGMNAEAPRFVARRRDHAALVALPAHDNRQVPADPAAPAARPKRKTRPYRRAGSTRQSQASKLRAGTASCLARN